jgi:hypothetical protein
MSNVYIENGYKDRADYLAQLADEYGDTVYTLASMLGANEDFDGLLTELEDYADEQEDYEDEL